MKKLLFILFIAISYISNGQLTSLVVRNDTIFNVDPSTGVWTQLTKNIPPQTGQSGKMLSTNGSAYQWVTGLLTNGDGSALTGLTASQVGLGNVTNESKATMFSSPTFTGAVTLPNSTVTDAMLSGSISDAKISSATTWNAKQSALVSGTNIKTINGTTLLGSGDIGVSGTSTATYVNLANNFSSSSTTESAVTGWSFAVTAGSAYRVEVIGLYQTAATTTGGELGFFLTNSGAGTIVGNAEGAIVSTAAASSLSQQISAIGAADLAGSNLITTGVTAINSPHYIKSTVVFRCTVSGTFNVGWASEVNASASQLNAGSSLIYQVLN